jgi:hypothetical protein
MCVDLNLILNVFIQKKMIQFQWGKLECHLALAFRETSGTGIPKVPIFNHDPQAVLYDPYSPAKNPELWSLRGLQEDSEKTCSPVHAGDLFTQHERACRYALRGFFVGVGGEVGEKEETTVAATHPELVEPLLDDLWLKRVMNSTNAEPISQVPHKRSFIQQSTWSKLMQHPQFEKYSFASELSVRH